MGYPPRFINVQTTYYHHFSLQSVYRLTSNVLTEQWHSYIAAQNMLDAALLQTPTTGLPALFNV